jgi:FkbM family methyltransferase
MGKNPVKTFLRYALEYLRHGDLRSIVAGMRYILHGQSHSRDRIIKTSIGHFFCRKNTNDFQYANYAYEWPVKLLFRDLIRQHNCFFDIGAGVGEYALLAAKAGLTSYAFEPVRQNYEVLRKNIQLNHAQDAIHTFNYGLGDNTGQVLFYFNPVNTGASGLCLERNKSLNTVPVQICTLDQVYPAFDLAASSRILMKIDVESMELHVLEGARKFLENFHHITLIIEKSHIGLEPLLEKLDQIGSFNYHNIDFYNLFAQKR